MRQHLINTLGIIVGWALVVVGLWQLEIVDIALINDRTVAYMPFFVGGAIQIWIFRDIWYTNILFGCLAVFWSTWFWEEEASNK